MSPCHLTGRVTLPCLQHQMRADLSFSLTDILGQNLFSPHLQGRFSKQSSPQGTEDLGMFPCAPAEPFPFWIIPYSLGWEFLAAGEHIRLFAAPWPFWRL